MTASRKIAATLRAGQDTGISWRAGPLNGGGPFGFVDPLPVSEIDTDRMARVEISEVGEDWVEVLHFVTDDAGRRYRRLIPFHAISAVVAPPESVS